MTAPTPQPDAEPEPEWKGEVVTAAVEVPAEWVEKAARIGFDLMAEGGRDGGRWVDLPEDDISKDYHRVLARYHLAAVLPEIQARAMDDLAVIVRETWAKYGLPCPWVGALDDHAARLRAAATEGPPACPRCCPEPCCDHSGRDEHGCWDCLNTGHAHARCPEHEATRAAHFDKYDENGDPI